MGQLIYSSKLDQLFKAPGAKPFNAGTEVIATGTAVW